MAKEEISKRGPITDYRPNGNDASGGSDKSVQTEALGAEGAENLANDSSTSGGVAGRINDLEKGRNRAPEREGGTNENNRGLTR